MKLMDLMTEERTNEFFRELNVIRVNLAFEIKKYLDPDTVFKPEIDGKIMNLMLSENFDEAVRNLVCFEIGSAHWHEEIIREGIEFAKKLYPKFLEQKADEHDKRRKYLLDELQKLDKQ